MALAYRDFIDTVCAYYHSQGRHNLPWRRQEPDGTFEPYKILVSEIMLQQTQVPRVLPKYEAFIREFPTAVALAAVPLGVVLVAWQGLGYNRRAKFLWQAAQMVTHDYGGVFPHTQAELTKLPGVGVNTAGAMLAYAYDLPVAFVETNIRTVFIHHFFHDETDVPDKGILTLVQATLSTAQDKKLCSPREYFWALMDYGTYLKQTVGNKSRASKSYVKQSKFAGSNRQLRGKVLRILSNGPLLEGTLEEALGDGRASAVLTALANEGFIRHHDGLYELS